MARFHINDKGNPGVCKALVQCPFGDFESEHYDSKEEARVAYEAKNAAFLADAATFTRDGATFNEAYWSGERTTVTGTRNAKPFLIGRGQMTEVDQRNDGAWGFFVCHKTSQGWYSHKDYARYGFKNAEEARQAAERDLLDKTREKLASLKATAGKTFTDEDLLLMFAKEKKRYHAGDPYYDVA